MLNKLITDVLNITVNKSSPTSWVRLGNGDISFNKNSLVVIHQIQKSYVKPQYSWTTYYNKATAHTMSLVEKSLFYDKTKNLESIYNIPSYCITNISVKDEKDFIKININTTDQIIGVKEATEDLILNRMSLYKHIFIVAPSTYGCYYISSKTKDFLESLKFSINPNARINIAYNKKNNFVVKMVNNNHYNCKICVYKIIQSTSTVNKILSNSSVSNLSRSQVESLINTAYRLLLKIIVVNNNITLLDIINLKTALSVIKVLDYLYNDRILLSKLMEINIPIDDRRDYLNNFLKAITDLKNLLNYNIGYYKNKKDNQRYYTEIMDILKTW